MRLTSRPSIPSTAAPTIASRSSAGVMARVPVFCHGVLATTMRTRSSSRSCRAVAAAATWPTCTGSNVPPSTPRRVMFGAGSGADQARHHRGEGLEGVTGDGPVAETELLSTGLQGLGDLLRRPGDHDG